MKIRLVRAELFHVDRRTYIHDEAHSRFSQSRERAEFLSSAVPQTQLSSNNINNQLDATITVY